MQLLVALAIVVGCDTAREGEGAAGAMGTPGHSMEAAIDTAGLRELVVPAEHQDGAPLYQATCSACHGEAGLGTAQGPPLVHPVYEPNHHADMAFVLAAQRGVRAHHWGFGDMPPQPAVTRPEIVEIIGYIRWLQRQAGIY